MKWVVFGVFLLLAFVNIGTMIKSLDGAHGPAAFLALALAVVCACAAGAYLAHAEGDDDG